jgi:hypothetical protein
MALRYQKLGQFGNTDYEQRKEDMIACGIPRNSYIETLAVLKSNNPGESDEGWRARRERFSQCMKAKGYLQLGLAECGPVKEKRGICK